MTAWGKKKASERTENRLREVEIKCDTLDSAYKKLDLEFTELFDKVSHQMSRMAARHAKAQKENGPTLPTDIETSPGDGLDPISRAIHERRGTQSFLTGETE